MSLIMSCLLPLQALDNVDCTMASCAPPGNTSDAIVSDLPAQTIAVRARSVAEMAVGRHVIIF